MRHRPNGELIQCNMMLQSKSRKAQPKRIEAMPKCPTAGVYVRSAVAAATLGQSLDPAATAATAPTTPTIVTADGADPAVAVPGVSEPLSPALPNLEATSADIEEIDAVIPLNDAATDQGRAIRARSFVFR